MDKSLIQYRKDFEGSNPGNIPIRLAQVGAFGYDPAHVEIPSDCVGVSASFPDETACARHLERIRWP